jgi:hypothetical protein
MVFRVQTRLSYDVLRVPVGPEFEVEEFYVSASFTPQELGFSCSGPSLSSYVFPHLFSRLGLLTENVSHFRPAAPFSILPQCQASRIHLSYLTVHTVETECRDLTDCAG